MGQRAAGTGLQGRALARAVRFCLGRPLAFVLLLAGLAVSQPCRAEDPVRGEATFTSGGGFARLVLKLAEDVESEVSTAGSIIIIHFKRPVDIPVDKLSDAVPDYVGSARRDPDGTAIRLSLSRRATVNTMTAGERIFVDFLPDGWTGPPPSLPAAVVRELAERARAASSRITSAGNEGGGPVQLSGRKSTKIRSPAVIVLTLTRRCSDSRIALPSGSRRAEPT